MYLATTLRPEIAFSVAALARYMSAPSPAHLAAAKRIVRYLRGTQDAGLTFRGGGTDGLVGYADASWGEDMATRRSTTGFVFIYAGAAVAWKSKLQGLVTTSTTEAELYVALCDAAQTAKFLVAVLRVRAQCQGARQRRYARRSLGASAVTKPARFRE